MELCNWRVAGREVCWWFRLAIVLVTVRGVLVAQAGYSTSYSARSVLVAQAGYSTSYSARGVLVAQAGYNTGYSTRCAGGSGLSWYFKN